MLEGMPTRCNPFQLACIRPHRVEYRLELLRKLFVGAPDPLDQVRKPPALFLHRARGLVDRVLDIVHWRHSLR
jgi:hypothetical protein